LNVFFSLLLCWAVETKLSFAHSSTKSDGSGGRTTASQTLMLPISNRTVLDFLLMLISLLPPHTCECALRSTAVMISRHEANSWRNQLTTHLGIFSWSWNLNEAEDLVMSTRIGHVLAFRVPHFHCIILRARPHLLVGYHQQFRYR